MMEEIDGVLIVAHELKAPLAVLRQLALGFDDDNSIQNKHIREEMISVSERAIRQVNDLARVRRLEDGLFKMEPVAVREVCDAVSSELKNLFGYNQCPVSLSYRNHTKLVMANRELLYSVIYNLLLNAMNYSDEGERARLSVQDYKGRIRVAVRDYGPALPMDIWREMKDGGVTRPTQIAMRANSSGLGLFIASKFSRYMNAELGAVRHRDGASFYLNLPISKQVSLFEL